jgi:hypothetical protein
MRIHREYRPDTEAALAALRLLLGAPRPWLPQGDPPPPSQDLRTGQAQVSSLDVQVGSTREPQPSLTGENAPAPAASARRSRPGFEAMPPGHSRGEP